MSKHWTKDKKLWIYKIWIKGTVQPRTVPLFCSTNSDSNFCILIIYQNPRPPPSFDLISKDFESEVGKVAYNKAKAESVWKRWKEKEEVILRELEVSEEIIEELRQADWEDFKEERRYQEHIVRLLGDYDLLGCEMPEPDIQDISDLLNYVENQNILHVLLGEDKKTLQIILLRMRGYQIKEIAEMEGIPEQTIYTRLNRLRKKINKNMMSE